MIFLQTMFIYLTVRNAVSLWFG